MKKANKCLQTQTIIWWLPEEQGWGAGRGGQIYVGGRRLDFGW